MGVILKPCRCGYEGALLGTRHAAGFFSLACPDCNRTVEAFTTEGLGEAWNKAEEPAKEQDQ